MAKYVNVDNFCEELNTFCDANGFDWYVPKYDLVRVMEKHTVEAEPIRHGKWRKSFNEKTQWTDWECSVCHKHGRGDYEFCPWCGAKMDEVTE